MPLDNRISGLIQNLLSALTIEINSVRGNVQTITAQDGKLVEKIGSIYIYKFFLKDRYDIPDDSDVLIRLNNNSRKAIIINCKGLELLISCEFDLGQAVESITLLLNNANLLESLKNKLEQIQSSQLGINTDLTLKLFGFENPIVEPVRECFIPPLPFELDNFQNEVISKTFNTDVSFIWGPPGTGKTIVIAILTKIFNEFGDSVLITSNTNIAVDNAFEKFINFFRRTSADLLNGKIIRYGNIQVEAIKELVQESNIVIRLSAPLLKRISDLDKKIDNFQKKKLSLENSIKDYEHYSALCRTLESNKSSLKNAAATLAMYKAKYSSTINSILETQEKISEFQKLLSISLATSSLFRFFKKIKSPVQINSEIAALESSVNSLIIKQAGFSNSISIFEAQCEELKSIIKSNSRIVSEQSRKFSQFPNSFIKSAKSEITEINAKIIAFTNQINEINKSIEEIETSLISNSKVLGTTLSMFHSQSKLYSRKYDVVIIDEVTMAILPQIFFAASVAQKKIIIVGDFMQLQPIVKSYDSAIVNDWLKQDIFSKNGISTWSHPKLNTLKIQRRMHPAIANITNLCLYNGILEHSPSDISLDNEAPVSFYNTADFSPFVTIPGNQGRINIYNAILISKILNLYIQNDKIESIGILTPYRKQANLLSKLVNDLKMSDKVSADTIHKFQGLEKDLIIFDISDGENNLNYSIGKNLRNDESPNLFNVAFTRARKKLIIVGDLSYLRKYSYLLTSKVQQMLHVITNPASADYEIINSRTLLPSLSDQQITNNPLASFSTASILQNFNSDSFYLDFLSEVSQCKESILIYSPFIAHFRVTNSFNDGLFTALINEKIRVTIFTKPINEHPPGNQDFVRSLIVRWRQLGININLRDNLHEKLAIIDNRIAYIGSLNILSQHASTEIMLKISSPNSIKELAKVYCR